MRGRYSILGMLPPALSGPARYLQAVGAAIQTAWRIEARQNLRARGQRVAAYSRGIVVDRGERNVRISLQGMFPNLLEQGMGPSGIGSQGSYDLRKFILKSRPFVRVPFNMSAALIKALGGSAARDQAAALPPTITVPGSGHRNVSAWGPGLPSGLAPKQLPHHATDPLHNVVRLQAGYSAGKTQSTYRKWRTMSATGKPWMSKGVRAARIAAEVVWQIPRILQGIR